MIAWSFYAGVLCGVLITLSIVTRPRARSVPRAIALTSVPLSTCKPTAYREGMRAVDEGRL